MRKVSDPFSSLLLWGLLAISLCYFGIRFVGESNKGNLSHVPKQLTKDEVNIIAEYATVVIPQSCMSAHFYYDSGDVIRHLYAVLVFDSKELSFVMKQKQWKKINEYAGSNIEIINFPVLRSALFQERNSIDFWNPQAEKVQYIYHELFSYDWGDEVTLFIEVDEGKCRLFVLRSCQKNQIPLSVIDLFPQKKNWDIREWYGELR